MANVNSIQKASHKFEKLVKLSFTEAPPVLLEKVFEIYKDMYTKYTDELRRKYNDTSFSSHIDDSAIPYLSKNYINIENNIDDSDGFIERGYSIKEPLRLKKKDFLGWRWNHLINSDDLWDLQLSLKLIIDQTDESGYAVFKYPPDISELVIFMPQITNPVEISSEKNKWHLPEIKQTINHELSHIFQSYITFLINEYKDEHKKLKELVGLPPGKLRGYDEHGRNQDYIRDQDHQFRLVEVYPRLGDSILRFKDQIKLIHKDQISEFIKHFIGLSKSRKFGADYNFEEVLNSIKSPKPGISEEEQKYNENVYKIMVKKFLSEINKLGYNV